MARDAQLSAVAAQLVDLAARHGERVEQARQAMAEAGAARAAAALALHTEHGLSVRQVAAALSISAGTAQQLIERARRDAG